LPGSTTVGVYSHLNMAQPDHIIIRQGMRRRTIAQSTRICESSVQSTTYMSATNISIQKYLKFTCAIITTYSPISSLHFMKSSF